MVIQLFMQCSEEDKMVMDSGQWCYVTCNAMQYEYDVMSFDTQYTVNCYVVRFNDKHEWIGMHQDGAHSYLPLDTGVGRVI